MQVFFQNTRLWLSVVTAFLVFISSCTLHEVDFKGVNDFKVQQWKGEKVRAILNVRLHNPNNFKIKIVKAEFDVKIAGASAGKATLGEKVKIRKKEEGNYDFILELDKEAMKKAILNGAISMVLSKGIVVRADGFVKGRVFIFGKKFDLDLKEKVDLSNLKF